MLDTRSWSATSCTVKRRGARLILGHGSTPSSAGREGTTCCCCGGRGSVVPYSPSSPRAARWRRRRPRGRRPARRGARARGGRRRWCPPGDVTGGPERLGAVVALGEQAGRRRGGSGGRARRRSAGAGRPAPRRRSGPRRRGRRRRGRSPTGPVTASRLRLGDPDDGADGAEDRLGPGQVVVGGRRAAGDGGGAGADEGRRVRHRPHDGDARRRRPPRARRA